MMTKKLAGHVAVDSGQVLLIDPCYLSEWRAGNYVPNDEGPIKNNYDEACRLTVGRPGYGELSSFPAVVSSTAHGDGVYPVYAELNEDGRVTSLTIWFEEYQGGEDEGR